MMIRFMYMVSTVLHSELLILVIQKILIEITSYFYNNSESVFIQINRH